jgi:N-acetylneuraminic acid mutarotase
VLVTGGDNYGVLNTAELYDPSIGTWTNTGRMVNARYQHTASELTKGKVLVIGGSHANSAELYDPSAGTWTTTGSMNNARIEHTASVLINGTVLVAGGTRGMKAFEGAELY